MYPVACGAGQGYLDWRDIVAEGDLEHARLEERDFGRVAMIKTEDAKKVSRVMAAMNEQVHHVG